MINKSESVRNISTWMKFSISIFERLCIWYLSRSLELLEWLHIEEFVETYTFLNSALPLRHPLNLALEVLRSLPEIDSFLFFSHEQIRRQVWVLFSPTCSLLLGHKWHSLKRNIKAWRKRKINIIILGFIPSHGWQISHDFFFYSSSNTSVSG